MKQNNKELIHKCINDGNVLLLKNNIKKILLDEINELGISDMYRNNILELVGIIEIPIKTQIINNARKDNDKNFIQNNRVAITSSLTGIVVGLLTRRLPVALSSVLSVSGAFLCGAMVKKRQNGSILQDEKNLVEKILSNSDEIIASIDKSIKLLNLLVITAENQKTDIKALHKNYPNILKWYQEAYSSCEEFGESCAAFYKKRIESVLDQSYYKVINYDGANSEMFKKTVCADVTSTQQYLPAIYSENELVLPGEIFIPSK